MQATHFDIDITTNHRERTTIIPGHHKLPEKGLNGTNRDVCNITKIDICKHQTDLEPVTLEAMQKGKDTDQERHAWNIMMRQKPFT